MKDSTKSEEILSDFSKQAQSALTGASSIVPSSASWFVVGATIIALGVLSVIIIVLVTPEKKATPPFVAKSAPPIASVSSDSPATGIIQQGGSAVLVEDTIAIGGAASSREDALFTERDFIVNGLPVIEAQAAVVKKLGDSSILFEQGNNKQWPIASISKLMTSVVALETLGPDVVVTLSEHAVATEGVSGDFSVGEQFTVLDLISAMMSMSSNDAAVAIADFYDKKFMQVPSTAASTSPQTVPAPSSFIHAMNEFAKRLSMNETTFSDPSGLSPLNKSTPTDLERLVVYIAKQYPEILAATRAREDQIIELLSRTPRTLGNINRFAGQFDFVGGKTGFTDEARGNLVSIFNYQGTEYLIIVFGTEDRFGETSRLYRWLKTKVGNS